MTEKKTTDRDGGAPALRGLVRAGLATPEEERRYFEQVVRPAWDARRSTDGEALDLTAHDIVPEKKTTKTTKEEGMTEQPYQRFLREQNAKAGTTTETTAATDMSEDAAFEAFAEQSGMDDLLGRKTGACATADLSVQDGDQAEISGTTDMSAEDEALYRQFVEQSGAGWLLGEAGAAAADLSEGPQAEERRESLRDQAEADELHESLRRQSHEDHYGVGSDLSDDEAWNAYQSSLGLS